MMDRSLPPSESKIVSLRDLGVVAQSPAAVRFAGGAAALAIFLGMFNEIPFKAYFNACHSFSSECRNSLELIISTTVECILATGLAYLCVVIATQLAVTRFYFRVTPATPAMKSTDRSWSSTLVSCSIGALLSYSIWRKSAAAVFDLFNQYIASGYTAFYGGIISLFRLNIGFTIIIALIGAVMCGFLTRMLYRREHAMTREDILRENRN